MQQLEQEREIREVMVDDRLVPLAAALEILGGIKIATGRALTRRGEIRSVRIGRKIFVRASEIRRLQQGNAE